MIKVDFDEVYDYDSMEKILNTIYPLYQHYGWSWGGEIPSRDKLESEIKRLAQSIIDNDHEIISTGRLIAYKFDENVIGFGLELGEFFLEGNE